MRRVSSLVLLALVVAGCTGGSAQSTTPSGSGPATGGGTSGSSGVSGPHVLSVRRIGRMPAPVQNPAVAVLGQETWAFGGLDATGSSMDSVVRIGRRARLAGRLPVPIHDAAAASLHGLLYVFGGGQVQSYPGIGVYTPGTGRTKLVGSLPTPLSDLAVATVGSTAYAVGGYTGSRFSRSVVAFDGHRARVVGTLPTGLRYAAVAAVGGDVLIAGGRTTAGPSSAIYRFRPADGSITRIGRLPRPLMHAGAGVLNGTMYVIGGITIGGATSSRVVAVRPDGSVAAGPPLPGPLSDVGVASLADRIVIVGGRSQIGPVDGIWSLSASTGSQTGVAGSGPVVKPHPLAMFHGPLPGDLLIADRGNDRLLVVNPRGRILWRYPSRPGQTRLHFDDDAFFSRGGQAIISNEEDNHDIVEIGYPSGRLVWRYGHPGVPGSSPGYLNTPDDAYRLPGGLVIVSDNRNCRVLEIRGMRIVRSIGQPGSCTHDPPRSIASPNGDTPLPDGHILVSEITGSYVDEFTLGGKLVRSFHAPVSYPSDPQLTLHGNIMLADYSRPGGVVILARASGRLLWSYRPTSGPGMLDHPSLAAMLPNGFIIVGDDYNDRIVIINPRTKRIVWQYGHTRVPGTAPGYLNTPDGFDFIPVTSLGRPDPAAIRHGP